MLFNSLEYIAFLLAMFVAWWATIRHLRVARLVLLAGSLTFYACWQPAYLILMISCTAVDFLCARGISQTSDPGRRKLFLVASLVYDLGVLALFQYFNFFMSSVGDVATWLDAHEAFTFGDTYLGAVRLDVLLPVGISFFTFQSMSYTIDVYRREMDAIPDYPRYLLFVSFFPQLVAGPIVRAIDLVPQLLTRPVLTDEMGSRGLFLIMIGLFKKVALADYLALNLVDRTFDMPGQFSSLEMLVGIYGYAFQIYCDFSAYSDIAIGSALLFGFHFPANFDSPYQSRNLQEFWRRWHISLSTWLRDYLYVSLGGNRRGPWRTYRNLLLTMLLGGLWHGAGWNFVIWGALHGGALAVLRALQRRREARGRPPLLRGPVGGALAGLLTFHYVCLAWVFFRTPDLEAAGSVLSRLAELSHGAANLAPELLLVLGVAVVGHLWPARHLERIIAGFGALPASVQGVALVAVGLGLRQVAQVDMVPFIYFQF